METHVVRCAGIGGFLPEYQTEGAAGADLRAHLHEDIVLRRGKRVVVPTGLTLEIPRGLEGQVRPRSGLAAKHGITVLNSPGTIDSDYRGELKVLLINLGDEDFRIRDGDRIAQIIFSPVLRVSFLRAETVDDSRRGSGGFGSTGI